MRLFEKVMRAVIQKGHCPIQELSDKFLLFQATPGFKIERLAEALDLPLINFIPKKGPTFDSFGQVGGYAVIKDFKEPQS